MFNQGIHVPNQMIHARQPCDSCLSTKEFVIHKHLGSTTTSVNPKYVSGGLVLTESESESCFTRWVVLTWQNIVTKSVDLNNLSPQQSPTRDTALQASTPTWRRGVTQWWKATTVDRLFWHMWDREKNPSQTPTQSRSQFANANVSSCSSWGSGLGVLGC